MEKSQATKQHSPRAAAAHPAPDASLRVVADDAVRSANALYRSVQEQLEHQTREAPYVSLGIAAGIGFVVGGGLASPLGQSLLRASFRAFGGTLLQSVLNAPAKAVERSDEPSAE